MGTERRAGERRSRDEDVFHFSLPSLNFFLTCDVSKEMRSQFGDSMKVLNSRFLVEICSNCYELTRNIFLVS